MIDIKEGYNAEKWEESIVDAIPEHKSDVLKGAGIIDYKMTAFYNVNVSDRIKFYDFNAPAKLLHEVNLPDIGTIGKTSGHYNETEFFYKFSSFTDPGTLFRLNTTDFSVNKISQTKIGDPNYNSDDYKTD